MNFFTDIKTNEVKKVRFVAVISILFLFWSLVMKKSGLQIGILFFSLTFLALALLKEVRNKENGLFLLIPHREPTAKTPKKSRKVKESRPKPRKKSTPPQVPMQKQIARQTAPPRTEPRERRRTEGVSQTPKPNTASTRQMNRPSPPVQRRTNSPPPSLTPSTPPPSLYKTKPPKL